MMARKYYVPKTGKLRTRNLLRAYGPGKIHIEADKEYSPRCRSNKTIHAERTTGTGADVTCISCIKTLRSLANMGRR